MYILRHGIESLCNNVYAKIKIFEADIFNH